MLLDEYFEMLNRDSKIVCFGYKIKESIFVYLKEYFYLINLVSYFDVIIEIYSRKGFYYIFSYKEDVLKVLKDL